MLSNLRSAGFDALPIVGLLSFLLGIVVAYQGADQLRQYGANIFIADLVGLSMLREFAPLITAIIIAGRSGSAYAAQIGTMSVTEEIDALRTLGIAPLDLLVLPKILALSIALPLLTVFADVLGVFGGMLMARAQLGVGFGEFLDRFVKAVSVTAYLVGICKAPVFAFIIAVVGCFQGFRTRGGADSVGRQTTRSVVQSIFPGDRRRRPVLGRFQCAGPLTCAVKAGEGRNRHRTQQGLDALRRSCRAFANRPPGAPFEVLALIGGSGSGKSTLLREMILLQRPDSGTSGCSASTWRIGDDEALALRQRWGVMFQHGGLFGSLTVKENVGLPLREHSRLDDRLIDEIAAWKLAITGLKPEVGAQYPSELSGGMIKRASLARAWHSTRIAVSRRANRRPRPRQRRRRRPARAQAARPVRSDHRHDHARPRPVVAGGRPRRGSRRGQGARDRLDVRALAHGPSRHPHVLRRAARASGAGTGRTPGCGTKP
jgi:ABC transport permease subunit